MVDVHRRLVTNLDCCETYEWGEETFQGPAGALQRRRRSSGCRSPRYGAPCKFLSSSQCLALRQIEDTNCPLLHILPFSKYLGRTERLGYKRRLIISY